MQIIRSVVLVKTLSLIALAPFCVTAQEKSHVTSERVTQATQELEKLAQKQIQENALPGRAIAVVFQDKIVYAQAASQSSAPVTASGNVAGLVEIGGGRKMFLECRGSGSPTVILESGYRNDAKIWSTPLEPRMNTVFPQVAKFTRVCAYDRPGTFLDADHFGRSTPVAMPRSARDLVSDLHALLQAAHIPGPYVFAAHSFGGIFARLYASTYPNEVVGMVLIDALSEKVKSGLTPEQWKLYVNFGFTKPTPGLEKYKEIETLDVNASFDQIEKPLPQNRSARSHLLF
jgi:hypothetical protein